MSILDPPIVKETKETSATAAAPAKQPEILDMKPKLVDSSHHSFNDENDEINRMAAKLRDQEGGSKPAGTRYPQADPNLGKEAVQEAATVVEAAILEPKIEKKV